MDVHSIDVFYTDGKAPKITHNVTGASPMGHPYVVLHIDDIVLFIDDLMVLEGLAVAAHTAARALDAALAASLRNTAISGT